MNQVVSLPCAVSSC